MNNSIENEISSLIKSTFAVVLNYNNFEETCDCIESLLAQKPECPNIIIVDNCSTDGSLEKLKKKYPLLTISKTDFNSGYAGGMNKGIEIARRNDAKYILISNNDLVYEQNALYQMLKCSLTEFYGEIPGIISPLVLYKDLKDTIYCAGAEFSKSKCGTISLFRTEKINGVNLVSGVRSSAEGACILIKSEVFDKCGVFSEIFFMYFEDLEFSLRASKLYRIVFCKDAVVYHASGAGKSAAEYSPLYNFYYTRNRFILFRDFPIFYKIYVFLFNTLTIILKALKIFFFGGTGENKWGPKLKSLFRGYFSGLKYFTGVKKVISNSPIIEQFE